MTVQMKESSGVVEISIEGRIDSNTSLELQKVILDAVEKTDKILIDFEKVSYISSAGLRVILMGQKNISAKCGTMELSKVSEMVMQVFTTVGFDKILTFVD